MIEVIRTRLAAAFISAFIVASPLYARDTAILVGVSVFDHLKISPLEGPINDVILMRKALLYIGYRDTDIITLADSERADKRPTRINILRVLKEQAEKVKVGDRVVLYFSGHGAQIPQNLALLRNAHVEPDGLDEVFLTRDTRNWNKAKRQVEGAITDDEIGAILSIYVRRGVAVWAIFDTCHSGDMARSVTRVSFDEAQNKQSPRTIWRGVSALELGVPQRINTASRIHTNKRTKTKVNVVTAKHSGSLIEFYASQSNEAAPEELLRVPAFALPQSTEEIRRYGVFTWELVNALVSAGSAISHSTPTNGSNATFSELAQRIQARYAERPFPSPEFRGDLLRSVR